MEKILKEEVIKRLEEICRNKFEYSLDNYENTASKIKLKCKKCGEMFERKFNNLMYNQTCPYCNGKQHYGTEWFIKKARKIHGDKYDYSKVEYKTTDEYVTVICHKKDDFGNEHGEFKVTPHAHVGNMKSGCPKCSGKYRTTTNEFIQKAQKIHGNKYDYSKTVYVRALSKVIIICKKHGEFLQKPNCHLSGEGCPYCRQSFLEREIRSFLEENNIQFKQQYTTDWLKPLHLDFFLPKYNLGIECQGLQHFKEVKYYGGEKGYQDRLERDKRKKLLCEKNSVSLLYYSTEDIDFPYEVIQTKEKLLEAIKTYENSK